MHGEHYFFVNHDEFKTMIDNDAFLEHAEVFGNYYGTSLAAIEQVLSTGVDVFLDIDWQGAQQIRAKMPRRAVSLYCRRQSWSWIAACAVVARIAKR